MFGSFQASSSLPFGYGAREDGSPFITLCPLSNCDCVKSKPALVLSSETSIVGVVVPSEEASAVPGLSPRGEGPESPSGAESPLVPKK